MKDNEEKTEATEGNEGEKLPPVSNHEQEAGSDFASVISDQAETIAKQSKQIEDLLKAVSNLTKAGANYQQGERPDAPEPGESPAQHRYENVKPLSELDFSI